jgi:tRNA A37 N6-isopentenylltransferase MiaA
MSRPDYRNLPAMSSLGYGEMARVAEGSLPIEQAVQAIRKQTRNYAKRQSTFFRHQFPTANRWQAADLASALDAVDWDWEAYSSRISGDAGKAD